jgi:geranylgeranyl pyrophosphate synthase
MHTAVSTLHIDAVKNLIDTRLTRFCELRISEASHIGPSYSTLWQSITSLLQAGGKRFRPYMLIATYVAYSGQEDFEKIVPAALAQELIHQAMLIHDDIIDRDTIRYGVKNIAGQYDDSYAAHIDKRSERTHMSLSAALLAGDVLLSDSYRLLSEVDRPQSLVNQAIQILGNGVFEVVGGELLDTESAFLPAGSVRAEVVARFKTASYSFISPITMGAVLAGAPAHEIRLLRQFAEYLGVGYQLRDDLLGVFGDTTKIGKSTTTDITEGKRTYLIEQFDAQAHDEQKATFYQLFHRSDLTESQFEAVKSLIIASGAKTTVEAEIDTLYKKATRIVAELELDATFKHIFLELIERCLQREM